MASVGQYFTNEATYVFFLDVPRIVWSIGFRGVVVITSVTRGRTQVRVLPETGFLGCVFWKTPLQAQAR